MSDPAPWVAGHGIERLRAAGVTVDVGVERHACAAINAVWIAKLTGGSGGGDDDDAAAPTTATLAVPPPRMMNGAAAESSACSCGQCREHHV